MSEEITNAVREYVLKEFLPGESPDALKTDTPLITGGILDSIATLKLVAFLEERFDIGIEAHEASMEHMDTVAQITELVLSKKR